MNALAFLSAYLFLQLGWGIQAAASPAEAQNTAMRPPVRLSAPLVFQAFPLLRAENSAAFREAGATAQFTFWRSPEQLRALVANGQVDAVVAALPTAAVLARRGVPCVALAAYAAPLWIVGPAHLAREGEPPLDTFRRLLAKEILLPFGPGNMPELAMRVLAVEVGLNVTHRHCGSAMEALNLLRIGQGSAALLPEPSASMALNEGTVVRLLDLREVWAAVFPEHRDMPTACFVAVGDAACDPHLRTLLRQSFVEGMKYMVDEPETAFAAARNSCAEFRVILERLPDGGSAFLRSPVLLAGERGKEAALFMLEQLQKMVPSSVGGALPPSGFWDMGHEK